MLLRGITARGETSRRSLPREIAVYDFRTLGDWEDLPGTSRRAAIAGNSEGDQDEVVAGLDGSPLAEEGGESETQVRTVKKFDFRVAEFAVDPGQDLLIVVEVK